MPEIRKWYEVNDKMSEIYSPDKDDGTFIMCFKDWRNIFTNVFICIDFPEIWNGKRLLDKWEGDYCGGVVSRQEGSAEKFA